VAGLVRASRARVRCRGKTNAWAEVCDDRRGQCDWACADGVRCGWAAIQCAVTLSVTGVLVCETSGGTVVFASGVPRVVCLKLLFRLRSCSHQCSSKKRSAYVSVSCCMA
jgi:hypothetical protein